ncbi:ornithine decarboxylase SPE1 PWA37_003202 [Arxiozyma heterogenica]|uniref:Ornithine decarboxylase n=1 Tax=Arxiozyma heterogenica TaxID=278026 RepID=A0AAN7WL76_9SACH|nr:hypothetical protein RI543_001686 [Kazachstania heterogenica]
MSGSTLVESEVCSSTTTLTDLSPINSTTPSTSALISTTNTINSKPVARLNNEALTALLETFKHDPNLHTLPHQSDHIGIFNTLKQRINSINDDTCSPGEENSFFVCDMKELRNLYKNWKVELPRVQPHYAVKCNPQPELLKVLASLGVNFDCASKREIDTILKLGIEPHRIIYANPCKVGSHIRYAQQNGVEMTTFDNAEELHKIKKFHPSAKLFLRIATDDTTAQCRLSTKFGAHLSAIPELLQTVKDLELNLVGVSFHVGSGASDFSSLYKATRDARWVFDIAVNEFGLPPLKTLDVGGGFQLTSFQESSKVLRLSLDEFFPENCGVNIIAEPGRYFAETTLTLATHIIAKRKIDNDQAMIYINDGVYGNLNCILFDHQEPTPRILYSNNKFHYDDFNSTSAVPTPSHPYKVSIWGPTCDGLDCITKEYYMRHDLVVGDWLYFPNLGAYTSSAATPFNGFDQHVDTIIINEDL